MRFLNVEEEAKAVLRVLLDSSAAAEGRPISEATVLDRAGSSRGGLLELVKKGLVDPRSHEDGHIDYFLRWGGRVCPRQSYEVADNGERCGVIIWRWPGQQPGQPPTLTVMVGADISYARFASIAGGMLTIGNRPDGGSRRFTIICRML